jgi:large subunit ribosomal protein L17
MKGLVEHGEIKTTQAKAKAFQRYAEKLAATAKKGDVPARRRVLANLANDKKTADGLVKTVAAGSRQSGFTRIVLLGARRGDNAQMARISWVDAPVVDAKTKATGEKQSAKTGKSKKTKAQKTSSKQTKKSASKSGTQKAKK